MNSKEARSSKILVSLLAVLMVLAMMPSMVFATSIDNPHDAISIATAEPVTIQWAAGDTSTTGTVVPVVAGDTNYPSQFVFYVSGTHTLTLTNATKTQLEETDDYTSYLITLGSTGTARIVVNWNGVNYTISTTKAPTGAVETTSKEPTYVNGYLPVGQYSSGKSWGSIYSDGANTAIDTTAKGTTLKIANGNHSGISIGAMGGYVQVEMDQDDVIRNLPTNKYGVDFVVYGNAFTNNAEAGSVMVSANGTDWYELAGSRYFMDDTLRNVNISYKQTTTGVQYKIWKGSTVYTDWTLMKTSGTTGWWPEYTSEGYGIVSGALAALSGTANVGNVEWSSSNTELTYKNVTLVKDEDSAAQYVFGYADAHANGTMNGQAQNPYASTASSTGGDGFDLAWAVYPEGTVKGGKDVSYQPVSSTDLPYAKYIRIYTSAGLQFDANGNPSMFVHSAFNETSTEVMGVMTNVSTGGSAASELPVITQDREEIETSNLGVTEVLASDGALTFSSDADKLYVNGTLISGETDIEFSAGDYVQVIAQTGDESPYVTILKIK